MKLRDAIFQNYKAVGESEPLRPHLGASLIGDDCERYLWLVFRWALRPDIEGRIYRLFETGKLAEPRKIQNLRDIGVTIHSVDEKTGKQFVVFDFGGHFSGSLDGIGWSKEVFGDSKKRVFEFKTAGRKSFEYLVANGLKRANKKHYAQVQVYMYYTGLSDCVYLSVNKDTDDIYEEHITLNKTFAEKLIAKAGRIIFSTHAPDKISENPEFFNCQYCDFRKLCHGGIAAPVPLKNCRTCIHSSPQSDGTWTCEKHEKTLTLDEQRIGCDHHLYIPGLLNLGIPVAADSDQIVYSDMKGVRRVNKRGGEITEVI